jgi:hypothetical protein
MDWMLNAIVAACADLVWRYIVNPFLDKVDARNSYEEAKERAIAYAPDAPRTAAGLPIVRAKNFHKAYPDGCPDPDAMAF